MLEHFVSRATTELSSIKRSSHKKDVTSEINWTLELGVQSGVDVSIYIIVELMHRDQFNQQQRKFLPFLDQL